MSRRLTGLLSVALLALSSGVGLVQHHHDLRSVEDSFLCVVDHSASEVASQSQKRAGFKRAGTEHEHNCLACHSSRIRSTSAAEPTLGMVLAEPSISRALDEICLPRDGACHDYTARGPPRS